MENSKTIDFYLMAVLAFSLLVNAALAMKVHKLTLMLTPSPLRHVSVGSKVESLDAKDVSGNARHLVFAAEGKPVVLYAFNPTCGWCAKNLDNIKTLYRLKHENFEFIGVSLSSTGVPEYISQSGFPLDVVKNPSAGSVEKFASTRHPKRSSLTVPVQ